MTRTAASMMLLAVGALAALSGCQKRSPDDPFERKPLTAPEFPDAVALPPYVVGTVAEQGSLSGGSALPVQAYGLVIGLGKNGSAEVPPNLEKHLTEYLLKNRMGYRRWDTKEITPQRILRDLDTAVVRVWTTLPPGSPVGAEHDLFVEALGTTSTKSLDGGYLMPIDMAIAVPGSMVGRVQGKSWALGRGSVFVNPFLDPNDRKDMAKLRSGRILNGAKVTETRGIKLILRRADYAMCRAISRRINGRFPSHEAVAKARSSSTIDIAVPPNWRSESEHFLQLVMHLPVSSSDRAMEVKAHEIAHAMEQPNANHEQLALVWEAIGRQVLPVVRQGYTSDNPFVQFWSAVAGLRMGDIEAAGQIVRQFARRDGSPLQLPAIRELGRHTTVTGATALLENLLDQENELVRIGAYESLLRRGDMSAVTVIDVGGQFELHLVKSHRDYVIYAAQTGTPRIVLFGQNMAVARPVFFNSPDGLVTVNASGRDDKLTTYRKIPRTGGVSDEFKIPFVVRELVTTLGAPARRGRDGEIEGLGLSYSQVVGVLHRMCKDRDIPARFVLQPPPAVRKIYQDTTSAGRPD